MADYNIQQKTLNSGGTYDNLYPKSKAGLVDLADTAGNFVSTDVEGALAETAEQISTKLPLVGGTLEGYLYFGDSTACIVRDGNVFDFIKGWVSIRLDSNLGAGSALQLRNTGSGALYKIYSEANITISTTAPASALAEGAIHMVY